jgi:hypothetical protein
LRITRPKPQLELAKSRSNYCLVLIFSVLLLNPLQAIPGRWCLAHNGIPSKSSKFAQFKQNRSYNWFESTSSFLGWNSWQHTEGPWCNAHRATLSMSLRSSRLAQSLQLSMCVSSSPQRLFWCKRELDWPFPLLHKAVTFILNAF